MYNVNLIINIIKIQTPPISNFKLINSIFKNLCNLINGHRGWMLKELPEDYDPDTQDDASLAIHLKSDHNLQTSESFDKNFRFTVVQISDPKSLAHNEYQWMSDLQTLKPFGLNVQKPYGIDEILLK